MATALRQNKIVKKFAQVYLLSSENVPCPTKSMITLI